MTAQEIVGRLLEDRKRFFVYLSKEDREAAGRYGVMSYRHKVMDRETVIDGHYKIMAHSLDYASAATLAQNLNANPESAQGGAGLVGLPDDPTDLNAVLNDPRPKPPVHNIGTGYAPEYRTF